jgi:hypothetical protein
MRGGAMMSTTRGTKRGFARRLAGVALGAAACGLLAGCAGMPTEPTYTDAELRAICERQGGWWRGELIAGYCEYQSASLRQSP